MADKNTLNGALEELGKLMATNLTTKGVASTYDMGLTTLANRILLINGGGGERTLTLTADKSILSYYDSDTATLSATLLEDGEPVTGETVEFWSGSVSLGTSVTNSSGVAEKVYSSTGSGDVELSASVGTLSSEIYEVEDCFFYGINTDAFTIPSSTTFSSNGEYITATTSTSGEKLVYLNHQLSNSDNWVFEMEVAKVDSVQTLAPFWNDNSFWGGQTRNNTSQVYSNMNGESTLNETVEIGKKFTITRQNGVTTVEFNNRTVQSKTVSHKSTFRVGFYCNNGRTQYYKNIKLKPL